MIQVKRYKNHETMGFVECMVTHFETHTIDALRFAIRASTNFPDSIVIVEEVDTTKIYQAGQEMFSVTQKVFGGIRGEITPDGDVEKKQSFDSLWQCLEIIKQLGGYNIPRSVFARFETEVAHSNYLFDSGSYDGAPYDKPE